MARTRILISIGRFQLFIHASCTANRLLQGLPVHQSHEHFELPDEWSLQQLYVYKMSGNALELASNFTFLDQQNWIDRQTRAVFVEFNTYNPNIKMFSYNYLLFEFLPTGSILK
jgi:hypothetical protein